MANAAWLSQLSIAGGKSIMPMSLSNADDYVTSQLAKAIDMYSASALDRSET